LVVAASDERLNRANILATVAPSETPSDVETTIVGNISAEEGFVGLAGGSTQQAGQFAGSGPEPSWSVAEVVRELAAADGATFRPAASLFRDFAIRCRQLGVASAHIDLLAFRRLFACQIAGLDRIDEPLRSAVAGLAEGVDDDVLAPYVAIVIAAVNGAPTPSEDELARLYGSSSPSRVRRLLEHLERGGLIVVREDFGGERTISVPGLAELLSRVAAHAPMDNAA
jgi:hypothetical protein